MNNDGKPTVVLLSLGRNPDFTIKLLSELDDINLFVFTSPILDFQLNVEEDRSAIMERTELANALNTLTDDAKNIYKIPAKLKKFYKKYLNEIETDTNIRIIYNTNLIEPNVEHLQDMYEILHERILKTNVKLAPITTARAELVAFKNKRWAPLRYYAATKQLPYDESSRPERLQKLETNYNQKELGIDGLNTLKELKLSDELLERLKTADLIIISATDQLSLAILFRAAEIVNKIKKLARLNKAVLLWNEAIQVSEGEQEMLSLLGFENGFESFIADIPNIADYLVTNLNNHDLLDAVLDAGTKVINEEIPTNNDSFEIIQNYLSTLLKIGQIELQNDVNREPEKEVVKSIEEFRENEDELLIKKDTVVAEPSTDTESKYKKESTITKEETKDKITDVTPAEKANKVEEITEEEIGDELRPYFQLKEEELWEDAVKRAIDKGINNDDENAINWLFDQCQNDQDQEIFIANQLFNKLLIIDTKILQNKVANVIARFYQTYKESYIQIYNNSLLNAILNKNSESRRELVEVFTAINSASRDLGERIISTVILSLTQERDDPTILEKCKLTLLQLVIRSVRLTKLTIASILTLIDAKKDTAPFLWSFLLAIDASDVAIELVTRFSEDRVDNMLRKSPLLRYTGSYITTIKEVISAWKIGDKNKITSITGSILPENAIKKLERMDILNIIAKMGTIPLKTLAETISKKPEEVEVLVAQLIMNDNAPLKMELIDNRMVIISIPNKD